MAEDTKEFVIKDKRIHSQNNTPPEDRASASETSAKSSKQETPLPKITFSTFIFSLNSSAQVQLGLIEDPATGKTEKNIPLAKQTIDLIGMLQEKTRGNLSEDETRLLDHVLYDLRLMYVKEMK